MSASENSSKSLDKQSEIFVHLDVKLELPIAQTNEFLKFLLSLKNRSFTYTYILVMANIGQRLTVLN